jgi:hypothetical protein
MIFRKFSDVVGTNIDMLSACIELRVLDKGESPLIISIDYRWLVLCESELS